MRGKVVSVILSPIDHLKYRWEGRDPDRRHAIMFGIAVKHGIPMSSIKRIDHDNGILEYYVM